jgi:hypothetical protein
MEECIAERSELLVFGYSQSQLLADLAMNDYKTRAAEAKSDKSIEQLREDLPSFISTERDRWESELKAHWLSGDFDGWLLADGGIAQAAPFGTRTNIVGVVKTHRKQYFRTQQAIQTVLSLKEGERTSAFRAVTGQRGVDIAYSWYLRLRDDPNESPEFGLVRVEMPPMPESLEWIDQVSSWLLFERAPLSLPDPRFDRMIYPIRRVEMYLKSLQPSDTAMSAVVGVF